MNVTIDVLDIRQVRFPNGQLVAPVSVVLVLAMLVYIVSTCMALFKRAIAEAPVANKFAYGSLGDPDTTSDVAL